MIYQYGHFPSKLGLNDRNRPRVKNDRNQMTGQNGPFCANSSKVIQRLDFNHNMLESGQFFTFDEINEKWTISVKNGPF